MKSDPSNQRVGGPYVREIARPTDEVLRVTEKGPSDPQKVEVAPKSRWGDEGQGTYEDMMGNEQSHRNPPLQGSPCVNSISVEQQTTATLNGCRQQLGPSNNVNTLAQTLEVLGGVESQLKTSNPVETLDEAKLPAFSWHTEKPTHPTSAKSCSTPANVMESINPSGETFSNTHGKNGNENFDELLELLTPMTDEEQDSNLTDKDLDYEESEPRLLRFPRNASREVVESYALLSKALKQGLEKRGEVSEAFEQRIEWNNAEVEMQEEWDKKEKWLERSRGSGGTRSRSGASGPEYPDFLDWLRQRGRDE